MQRVISEINQANFRTWRNRYKGKKIVICGSGSSLDALIDQEEDCIYIALNKALFYSKIKFDILFMQDMPNNSEFTLEDYNKYPCDKFYGIITNPALQNMGIDQEKIKFGEMNGKIYRYELSPCVFRYQEEQMEMDIDKYCISDAQSVLFSALQFAVFSGSNEIALCGVDFSGINYGNTENKSHYARNVVDNLISLKKQLKIHKPDVRIYFLKTYNEKMQKSFYAIDHEEEDIIVSGIYTDNYTDMVKLQERTCKDGYLFDFRHISDEEWNQYKSLEGFAFWGGNTLKTQLVIDKIKKYFGKKYLLITDADIIFLKETKEILLYELRDADMLFLRERLNDNNLYKRASVNVNIGFVCMRCNDHSLAFWEEVQRKTKESKGWDQEIANDILHAEPDQWNYKLLNTCFLNGGEISKENVQDQMICTACGTIAERNGLGKYEFLMKAYELAQRGEWFQ